MNGMFMNSRGLGDLAKHLHITDCVRDYNLDFVAISEAGRRDFPVHVLNRLACGQDFTWHYLPPRGRSGGILLGVKMSSMDVLAFSVGEFHIKVHLPNKAKKFTWSLVVVYGQPRRSIKLLSCVN